MTPNKVTFYVYAENDAQVQELQTALNNFVRDQYNKGTIVSATKLTKAIRSFGNNFLITNFLRK